jgi:ribonuclease-3
LGTKNKFRRLHFLGKSNDTREFGERESLFCDVFEVIYLDGGFENAGNFVLKFLDFKREIVITDYKSKLQEITQQLYKNPDYIIVKEFGSDHNKKFKAAVFVNSKLLGNGVGSSKKSASSYSSKSFKKRKRVSRCK